MTRGRGRIDRPPVVPATKGGPRAVVEERGRPGLRDRVAVREVRVVALGLTGEQGVQAVVDVVRPLRVQTRAAGGAGCDRRGVVAVGLGDQQQRTAQVTGEGIGLGSELLQEGQSASVVQGMDGIQGRASMWKSRNHIRALSSR